MDKPQLLLVSQRERDRLKVLHEVQKEQLSQNRVAARLRRPEGALQTAENTRENSNVNGQNSKTRVKPWCSNTAGPMHSLAITSPRRANLTPTYFRGDLNARHRLRRPVSA